jgi:hypothetical protein
MCKKECKTNIKFDLQRFNLRCYYQAEQAFNFLLVQKSLTGFATCLARYQHNVLKFGASFSRIFWIIGYSYPLKVLVNLDTDVIFSNHNHLAILQVPLDGLGGHDFL